MSCLMMMACVVTLATIEQFFAAAKVCPTQAIIIEQFGRRVFPRILTPMFGEDKEEKSDPPE